MTTATKKTNIKKSVVKEESNVIMVVKANSRGEVRLTCNEYKGETLVDLRQWYVNDKGDFIATQKGISLKIEEAEKIYNKETMDKIRDYITGKS